MAQTLEARFLLNDKYTASMLKIMKSQDDFTTKQKRADKATEAYEKRLASVKKSADGAASGVGGLAGKIAGMVSMAYLGKKALDGMFAAINTSALQQVQETTFQALLNSEKIGSQLYKYVGAYAKASALSREQVATATTSFLNVTKDINQLEMMIKFVERLQAKDPTKGADQAVFSIRELLAGDTVSARGVYGITGISGEELRGLKDSGDIAGLLALIDKGLNSVGATTGVVEKNFNGLITQIDVFKSNMMTAVGEAATPTMERLAETVQRLNADMDAGKYQPFINLMVSGMEMIGNGIAFVAENAYWLIPAVGGVVTAIVAYNVAIAVAGAVTNGLAGNWIGLAATAVGVAAAVAGMNVAMNGVSGASTEAQKTLDQLKREAGAGLETTAKVEANITNTAPISVKGTMEIESESLKTMMDFAGMKVMAMYSTATLAPQVTVKNMNVSQEADVDELLGRMGDALAEMTAAQPAGMGAKG